MYTKRIIPCLDVNNGRVVKGTNFVNLRDAGNPVEAGKLYTAVTASCMEQPEVLASIRPPRALK